MVEILIIAAYVTTGVLIFIEGRLISKFHESCKEISEESRLTYIIGMTIMMIIGTLTMLVWPVIMIGIKLNDYRNRH